MSQTKVNIFWELRNKCPAQPNPSLHFPKGMRYLLVMIKLTSAALFFLAAGIFTSVTILSGHQVLFVAPLCYYLYLAVKEKNLKLPVSAWFLLAFTGVALLSLVINFDLIPKPSKNFGRLKYFLYGVGGIFVLRVWLVEASDKAKAFISNTFLVSIVVAGLYAIQNWYFSEFGRARGLTDTMRYGYGSGMLLLSLLSCLLHKKNWFNRNLGWAALIIGFAGMYFTYTRGALLGLICGLPFVFYFYRSKIGLAMGAIALVVVIALGSFYLLGTEKTSSRFISNKNNSSDVIRRSQWKAAVIAIKEKPILGYGLSNFHSQLKRIKETHDLDEKDYNDAHSHNLFLEIGAGTGLIGLFIFLGWLTTWAYEAFRAGGIIRAAVVPFGVALVISSQFEVTLDANNASMIFILYALSSAVISHKSQSV